MAGISVGYPNVPPKSGTGYGQPIGPTNLGGQSQFYDTGGFDIINAGVNPYADASRSSGAATGANTKASANAKDTGSDYSVDQYGNTAFSNATGSQNNAARLQAEADARRMAAIQGLWSQSGGASAPHVGYGGAGGAEEAARAAAFARAKDQSGKIALSGLKSVQENMSGRGISGSGIQDLSDAGVLQGAQVPLQELTRDQMMLDLNRGADISDMTYQGDITQRGQTLQAQQQQIQQLLGLFSSRY